MDHKYWCCSVPVNSVGYVIRAKPSGERPRTCDSPSCAIFQQLIPVARTGETICSVAKLVVKPNPLAALLLLRLVDRAILSERISYFSVRAFRFTHT